MALIKMLDAGTNKIVPWSNADIPADIDSVKVAQGFTKGEMPASNDYDHVLNALCMQANKLVDSVSVVSSAGRIVVGSGTACLNAQEGVVYAFDATNVFKKVTAVPAQLTPKKTGNFLSMTVNAPYYFIENAGGAGTRSELVFYVNVKVGAQEYWYMLGMGGGTIAVGEVIFSSLSVPLNISSPANKEGFTFMGKPSSPPLLATAGEQISVDVWASRTQFSPNLKVAMSVIKIDLFETEAYPLQ